MTALLSKSDFLNHICDFISSAHNPSLVIKTESPNANTIYHVYSDGEITYQKGGWAYLQRSVFTLVYPKFRDQYVDLFPIKQTNKYGSIFMSYAIVTEFDAKKIVEMLSIYDKM